MPISKPFVIATEGRTVDGRTLPRDWLVQMAANYDPTVYTAVVNLEHYLSYDPDSTFSACGKVLSLKTQTAKIMGQERLQLIAVAEASDEAAKLQAGGKKCFASVEIVPDFADSGQAYLTGLALTDSPAALGTEAMKFSTFTSEQGSERLALAQETRLEFEAVKPENQPEQTPGSKAADPFEKGSGSAGILEKALSLFGKPKEEAQHTPPVRLPVAGPPPGGQAPPWGAASESERGPSFASMPLPADQELLSARQNELADDAMLLKADVSTLKTALNALREEFGALKHALSKIDASTSIRPPAPGGNATLKTDC